MEFKWLISYLSAYRSADIVQSYDLDKLQMASGMTSEGNLEMHRSWQEIGSMLRTCQDSSRGPPNWRHGQRPLFGRSPCWHVLHFHINSHLLKDAHISACICVPCVSLRCPMNTPFPEANELWTAWVECLNKSKHRQSHQNCTRIPMSVWPTIKTGSRANSHSTC